MIPFLSLLTARPMLTALVVVVVLSGAAIGVTRWQLSGARAAQAKAERRLSDYEAAASAVIAERLRAQAAEKQRTDRIAKELKDKHEREVADIRARYDAGLKRLRNEISAARERAGVPSTPGAPSGADGADAIGRFASALERCEAAVRRLDGLQRWVRETR